MADVIFREHSVKLLEAVVLVLVCIALIVISKTKVLQVWNDLSDLESMSVVWQWEWSISPNDLV